MVAGSRAVHCLPPHVHHASGLGICAVECLHVCAVAGTFEGGCFDQLLTDMV